MMDKDVMDLIRRIVEYKWHGEGEYEELASDVESISDDSAKSVLRSYLEEAREFVEKNALERDVERELLEEWILRAKPMKMKYKDGRYEFNLNDEEESDE